MLTMLNGSVRRDQNDRWKRVIRWNGNATVPAMNGNAVARIVFLLPRYSMHGPPAMPPKSALNGMIDPIHMP